MKHLSPQLGFNNNVRHKGRVFHIQTEDSGYNKPHIITHLFADGGRILKSTKTSYAEHLDNENLPKKVRGLMQEQHKAMFIALRAGKFDHMVETVPLDPAAVAADEARKAKKAADAAEAAAAAMAVGVVLDPAVEPAAAVADQEGATEAIPSLAAVTVRSIPVDAAPESQRDPQPSLVSANEFAQATTVPAGTTDDLARRATAPDVAALSRRSLTGLRPPSIPPSAPGGRLTPPPVKMPESRPSSSLQPRGTTAFGSMLGRASSPDLAHRPNPLSDTGRHESAKPPAAPSSKVGEARPTLRRPTPPGQRPPMTANLDLAALAAASEQSNAPVYKQVRDLPPPPAAVFKGNLPETTGYRALVVDNKTEESRKSQIPPAPSSPLRSDPRREETGPGRYAPSRPAAIFGQSRPQEGASIFGEDLISEKSLDEVILSYLAEDLEGGGRK